MKCFCESKRLLTMNLYASEVTIARSIEIKKVGITQFHADRIVNAANPGLWEGGGVCGAIFRETGSHELQTAYNAIVGCEVGNAVITPAFQLKARYIIHAVGPSVDR